MIDPVQNPFLRTTQRAHAKIFVDKSWLEVVSASALLSTTFNDAMSDETIRLVALNPADYKSTTVSLPKPPRDRSRFAVLLLLVFIPFGGHFFKAAQSAMQPYFMASGLMDATRYGARCTHNT